MLLFLSANEDLSMGNCKQRKIVSSGWTFVTLTSIFKYIWYSSVLLTSTVSKQEEESVEGGTLDKIQRQVNIS